MPKGGNCKYTVDIAARAVAKAEVYIIFKR